MWMATDDGQVFVLSSLVKVPSTFDFHDLVAFQSEA